MVDPRQVGCHRSANVDDGCLICTWYFLTPIVYWTLFDASCGVSEKSARYSAALQHHMPRQRADMFSELEKPHVLADMPALKWSRLSQQKLWADKWNLRAVRLLTR
jgi:hypothetical protein